MRNLVNLMGATLALTASASFAVSLEIEKDGYTLDWASSRLKYEANADSGENSDLTYSEVEKKAWAAGISEIRKISEVAFVAHYVGESEESEAAKSAGLRAARGVFSKNTEYVSDGSVNVALQARLSNVLGLMNVEHEVKEKPDYKTLEATTGFVFNLSCEMQPRADLKLEDGDGNVVYSPAKISEAAYGEVLTGRWYRKPQKWEIRKAAGKAPKEVAVTCLEDGTLVADMEAWKAVADADRDVIVKAARVAIVLP